MWAVLKKCITDGINKLKYSFYNLLATYTYVIISAIKRPHILTSVAKTGYLYNNQNYFKKKLGAW